MTMTNIAPMVLRFIEVHVCKKEDLFNPFETTDISEMENNGKMPLIVIKDGPSLEDEIIRAFDFFYEKEGDRKGLVLLPAKVDDAVWLKFVQPWSFVNKVELYFLGRCKEWQPNGRMKKPKVGFALLTVGLDFLELGVVGLARETS
jgi:hypothetical protein